MRRRWNRTGFRDWCAISDCGSRRRVTESSVSMNANSRLSRNFVAWEQWFSSMGPRRFRTTRLKTIRAVAIDVDGVLSDGGVWWGPLGEEWKRFSFADIMGISLARKSGLLVTLISGEDSPLVDRFAAKMNLPDITKGCKDKASALRAFAKRNGHRLDEICFMG